MRLETGIFLKHTSHIISILKSPSEAWFGTWERLQNVIMSKKLDHFYSTDYPHCCLGREQVNLSLSLWVTRSHNLKLIISTEFLISSSHYRPAWVFISHSSQDSFCGCYVHNNDVLVSIVYSIVYFYKIFFMLSDAGRWYTFRKWSSVTVRTCRKNVNGVWKTSDCAYSYTFSSQLPLAT